MKSEKGVTLISVTIYVIVMTLLVAIISVITNYFYKNVELNESIYVGKVKIASSVKDCDFILVDDTKIEINIIFEGEENDIVRTNTFNLKNSNF